MANGDLALARSEARAQSETGLRKPPEAEDLFGPESILPEQWASDRQLTGEQRMALGFLDRLKRDLLGKNRRLAEEARNWLFPKGWTVEDVCVLLELDKADILRWIAEPLGNKRRIMVTSARAPLRLIKRGAYDRDQR